MSDELLVIEIAGKKYNVPELCLDQDEVLAPLITKLNLSAAISSLLDAFAASGEGGGLENLPPEKAEAAFGNLETVIEAAFDKKVIRTFVSHVLVPVGSEYSKESTAEVEKIVGKMKNSQIKEVVEAFLATNLGWLSHFRASLATLRATEAENE